MGPSVFMGESVGLQMNTWGPWGSRCSWRNVGGEAPHTVSTISLKVFPGPCGRPSLKKPHPTTKPYCLQVPGFPVSIALREYQIRHGFQRPRATWGPWGSRCSWRNVGGEAPHTVSTIYLKVFPGPAVGQASKEYTQKRSHTAFKYPASRSPLPYGCIKIAMGSRAFELALPQSWSRGRAADRNIDAE